MLVEYEAETSETGQARCPPQIASPITASGDPV